MKDLFGKLPTASRQELLASNPWSDRERAEYFANAATVIEEVCKRGRLEDLRVLLDHGLPVDGVDGRRNGGARAIPLALLDYRLPQSLGMAKLLLERGANPNATTTYSYGMGNGTSPMHAAVQCAPALKLLIAHGGDVKLRDGDGAGLLDRWVPHTLYFNRKIKTALDALQVMVDAGLPTDTLLKEGGAFLPACWASPGLRKNMPRMFQMGFDPMQRGQGTPARCRNLLDLARIKCHKGVGGDAAGAILSSCEARLLEEATPAAAPEAPRRGPRL